MKCHAMAGACIYTNHIFCKLLLRHNRAGVLTFREVHHQDWVNADEGPVDMKYHLNGA